MNVSEISAKDLTREVKVEVPKGEIENKLVSKLEELKNTVQLKGFRPGKVPLNHLRRVFGQRLMPEIIEETIKETSAKVLSDRNEKPAIQPKINFYDGKPSEKKEKEAIDKVINAEKDLSYTMIYEIIPEIISPKYETISITKRVAKVTTEDIKEALDRIAAENKSYEERKSAEKSKDGDQLTIDFIGKIDGEVFDGGSANDAPLVIGSGAFIPGFEEQLKDVKNGDEINVKVKFPDDYQVEHLAGKDAVFETKIKKIEKPVATKVNEDFAKKLGFENLQKLKDQISEQLEKDYESISKSDLKRKLMDGLDEKLKFDLPPTLVSDEAEIIWNNYKRDIESSGKKIEDVVKDEKKTKKEYDEIAKRRVKLGLFFNKIAEDETITVSDDEVNRALFEQARNYPGQESEIIKFYQENPNALIQIKSPLIEDKVVDFIITKVKVKNENVTRSELLGHDHDHDHDHDSHDHDHDHDSKPKKKSSTKAKAAKDKDGSTNAKPKNTKNKK